MEEENAPHTVSRRVLEQGRFIGLEEITWRGADGQDRRWEAAERVVGKSAVLLIPWRRPSNTLILIRQYRPPAEAEVLEFPAGLIDEGETPEEAAHRELLEETGYHGTILQVLPPAYNSPGLTSETVYPVFMDIDETRPENESPTPRPDDGEHIEVVGVPRERLGTFLATALREGVRFDSKVLAYLTGMVSERELRETDGDWLSRFFAGK